jgi:hypothetical protein
MSIFTGRELEFLASLKTSWRRLYWNELARLLKEDDNACDARHEAHSIAPQSGGSRRPEDYSAAASRT